MEIKILKQPYRRMAEYLLTQNCIQEASDGIYNFYKQGGVMDLFCNAIDKGHNPPITEEIKKNFPPEFDFSGKEEAKSNDEMLVCTYCGINPLRETCKHPKKCSTKTKVKFFVESANDNMSLFDKEIQRKIEDENLQKRIYTQLAKEGKFDQLPDTCEFSEAVELEVWNEKGCSYVFKITGRYKGFFMKLSSLDFNAGFISTFEHAQLHTKKIDFSQFKTGDVVEVELSNEEKRIGWFDYADRNQVVIKTLKRKGNQVCNGGSCSGSKMFNVEKIKSITKIK